MFRAFIVFLALTSSAQAQKVPFDVDALLKIARIGDPQLSPDGTSVAFTAQRVDFDKNALATHIYVVPVAGGAPKQITSAGSRNERPRWAPDSKKIAFVSDRGGAGQVWLMDPDGAHARQVTNLSTEAGDVVFSPNGKQVFFTSNVYPECADDACNKKRLEADRASKVKARIYTSLLYRHWNEWRDARRKHILVADLAGGAVRDLTPGTRDVPPFSLGGPDDFAVSPDGEELCYVMNPDPEPATSTNSELYVVPASGGEATKITVNVGADASPRYSPDGKHIAYRAQVRGGYESDRWRLVAMQRDTGESVILTESLDRSVSSLTWSPDSTRLFFTVEDRGRKVVQMIPVTGGGIRVIASGASQIDDVQLSADGKVMIYAEQRASRPAEIFRASSTGGAAVPLTRLNDLHLGKYQLTAAEEFWVDGAGGAHVHNFLVKPPGFVEGKKYPVLFLIHGGPQGAWGEDWTYRWNAQVFAGAGYVVVMPNPRGSTGYGEKFTDEIAGDWGGKVYDDLMAVVDYVAKQPYADAGRMAAGGGSYGGYMVNWILGHSNRFKALVSHAGVYDLRSMFGETEELWFPLWDFPGTPWDNPETYSRWSPSYFAKVFRTPTLVIHGELDYRVPVGQGLQLFTALQLRKAPSKLLLFPDEGHWVNKPQNSALWYKTFIDWIDTWAKNAGTSGEKSE
jgi:dipeptidyl aminopeptidase/acylaminoacyl peptidase